MGRTHDVIISNFDLDRLEAELDGAISELSDAKVSVEYWIGQAERFERERDSERALADRLADYLNNLWHHHSLTEASYDYIDNALDAWKEARSE